MRGPTRHFSRWGIAPLALVALVFALNGCSSTCDYGSEGALQGSKDCKDRPEPTAEEINGYKTAAMAPRLKDVKARGINSVNGIRVGRWGELWVTDSSDKSLVLDVNGEEIEPKDDFWKTTGHNSFAASKAKPAAVETAMAEINRIAPNFTQFNDADLYDFGVGERAGVRWYITVQDNGRYRTFVANTNGKLVAEVNREQGGLKPIPT